MKPLQARYNIFCNEGGGTHDDVIFYRLADALAARRQRRATPTRCGPISTRNRARRRRTRRIATARRADRDPGPREIARDAAPHVDVDIAVAQVLFCAEGNVDGSPCGHRAHRLHRRRRLRAVRRRRTRRRAVGRAAARSARRTVSSRAVSARATSCGWRPGCRSTVTSLTEEITPLQAGLDWAVKFDQTGVHRKAALDEQRRGRLTSRIAGLDARRPRAGARRAIACCLQGEAVGEVRSGSIAPSLGTRASRPRSFAKRLQPPERCSRSRFAATGPATVVTLPFYKRSKYRSRAWRRPAGSSVQQRARMGEDSTATSRRSGSPTTRRTRSATSSTSSCRRSARSSSSSANVGVVESVKAVSDIFSPIGGEVTRGQRRNRSDPALVNREPFAAGWLFKLKIADAAQKGTLLSAGAYDDLVKEQ